MRATAELLARGGHHEVSSRAVSTAAGVQAPTIYRQFGDMRGLLDAVARETFAEYVRQKATREQTDDSIEDLRRGWDIHVAFGLANPAVHALIYDAPTTMADASVARDAATILNGLVARVAEAGRLRVTVPHAVSLIAAAGEGVTRSLIATPPDARDLRLSATMREAVIAAITVAPLDVSPGTTAPGQQRVAASAARRATARADVPGVLSSAERLLLGEWLDRLADVGG